MKIIAVILTCSILFYGCGLIFAGSGRDVDFSTSPDGAEVWVNGAKVGVTPCKIELKVKEEYTIEFKKEGYATKSYRLTNHVGAGWVVLDILGGLIPVVVDAATGSWYEFDQEHVNMMLEKNASN